MPVKPHHIIAIGASAGGMEEINTFFDHTPLDGVSYVIIQHLSPVFKSRMVELLAKHSKLVVREAENGMPLLCNEVYLIPNDKFMTLANGKFNLTGKDRIKGPHLTINTFFDSLAATYGNKAIGVVLSGLGADGTEGAIAIKQSGGMVMARNPETAEFSSMPYNAIASGAVDIILEPQQMPNAIEDYVQKGMAQLFESQSDDDNVKSIIKVINDQLPLDFSDYKQATILRRIKRRAAYNNYNRLENYLAFLKINPEEVETLAQDFLISVTSFFRDKAAFDLIQKDLIPGILANLEHGEELKLWVPGCATGEEAYSMAIIIDELLIGKYKDVVVKIFATDIDSQALVTAGKGLYGQAITKDISGERIEKYFITEGNQYKIKPSLRKTLIFSQHDLVKNPPYCNMHIICCRNLLIYMTPALQKKVYLMLLFGLRKNGYLFLGSSENPMVIAQHLEVIDKKWKIYKTMETKRAVYFDGFTLPQMADIKDRQAKILGEEMISNNNNTLMEAVNAALVEENGRLAICMDTNNQVVKTYGDTTKYLLQKNFNLNLTELLPKPLSVAMNSLVITAKKTNKKSSLNGIKIKTADGPLSVNVSVSPLTVKNVEHALLLAIFSEDKDLFTPVESNNIFDDDLYLDEYTLLLEEELYELKIKLAGTYEQLDASNDNMQSYNEELLSANEEMQSTNEEMQSVNEELHTINADYQLKNKELLELNDDLNNYFRSNIHGQLFVNNELLLMKFSPSTVDLINLLPTDVGRPLSNISTNIKFETFEEDIKKVLENGTVITKEIQTKVGTWYQVVTMPYIQQLNNKKNGAIITFNDITELKKTQIELDKKNNSLQRINDDLDNFVHTASHDLLAPLGNIEVSIAVMNKVKVVDPELNGFLTIINTSVQKFRSLITEIATIAKVESDMLVMEMVDIEDTIKNVEWSLADKIKISGAVINLQLNIKQILFSKKNLRIVLFNLISNGIKFQSELPPVIDIYSGRHGENVILSVQDNGIGISKENVHKIFGMYNRLDTEVEGQGIGLYLVKKIIDAAGASITMESVQPTGSKFIINFNLVL